MLRPYMSAAAFLSQPARLSDCGSLTCQRQPFLSQTARLSHCGSPTCQRRHFYHRQLGCLIVAALHVSSGPIYQRRPPLSQPANLSDCGGP
eukprot:1156149-Pelagomonas_calceolata.AAC.1